jgi:nitroreductase/NAD-dependent dihydropyrimidine dehydrogenase PreA subunit
MAGIIVDKDRCTGCSICAEICPLAIIDSADATHLPLAKEAEAARCINCGHCEIYCPTGALTLNYALDEKTDEAVELGEISPNDLGIYLKSRRSVRHFTGEKVEKEKIERLLDIVRYSPSGMNAQPVQWLVAYDEKEVQRLAELTIDWMRYLSKSENPLSAYAARLVAAWERGIDPICWNAPHILMAHIPEHNPIAPTDAVIALTYFDVAAPAFGLGTCWAGFLAGAARFWEPMKEALAMPTGRIIAYAMLFGYPQHKIYRIPRRNPVKIIWR